MSQVQCPKCKNTLRLGKLGNKYAGRTITIACKFCQHQFDIRFKNPATNPAYNPANNPANNPGSGMMQAIQQSENVQQSSKTVIKNSSAIHYRSNTNGWLILERGGKFQSIELQEGANKIGRLKIGSTTMDPLVQPDSFISREHAVLIVEKDKQGLFQYYFYDVGSSNGSYINKGTAQEQKLNNPQEQIYLKDGDVITLGLTRLILKTSATVKSSEEALQWALNNKSIS